MWDKKTSHPLESLASVLETKAQVFKQLSGEIPPPLKQILLATITNAYHPDAVKFAQSTGNRRHCGQAGHVPSRGEDDETTA